MSSNNKRVILVDSMSVFFRYHFALGQGAYKKSGTSFTNQFTMQTKDGLLTAGLFGVTKTLLRCMQEWKADYMYIIYDIIENLNNLYLCSFCLFLYHLFVNNILLKGFLFC